MQTFSKAVNSGSRWWNWKTKPIRSLRKRDSALSPSEKASCPSISTRKRADDLQQRGLARAAGADDRDDFAFGDVERDALEHFEVAETLVYVGNFYHAVAMVICGSVRMRRRA